MIADQSFSTTHLGVDEFGNPFPPGEQTQFSQNVVRQRTNVIPGAPFQDTKQLTPYAQASLNQPIQPWMKLRMQRIAQQWGEKGPIEYNDIEDSSHIPTEEFIQKLEKRGAYGEGNEPQKRIAPTVIPPEPITEGGPTQAPQEFQKLRKKKMTRFELDTAGAKYRQTIEQFFKAKPTPVMQNLEEEIKRLEEAVKKAPEPMMDENFLYKEEKKQIEKRKNEAIQKQQTKKLHRLEQQELILEQERNERLRLEELQKLQLAAEQELISYLELRAANKKRKRSL